MLTRRDNTKFMKRVYQSMILEIIDSTLKNISKEDLYQTLIMYVISELNLLYSHGLPLSDFVMTKSIKENTEYKIRALPTDEKKRQTRLNNLKCETEEEYMIKALPPIVQLAEKMRRRGLFVPAGSRIEYVFLDINDICSTYPKANQWEKVEHIQYYKEHSNHLKLDLMHYNKLLINPIDQLLNIVKSNGDFMKEHYEDRLKKYNMIQQLKSLFLQKIKIEK